MLSSLSVTVAIAFITSCCSLVHSYAINSRHNSNNEYATFEPAHCQSEVYCRGDLLHTVQMAKLYNDSKTFVDMKMKESPQTTLDSFRDFMAKYDNQPSKEDIRQFVNDYFEKPGAEFVQWVPQDWKESPAFLDKIKDPDYRQWASDLHAFWKQLGRQMTDDVAKNPDHYSIIHVKNPVIVPGGRFREFYYWDSYWIIQGLLQSEMYSTAKGMLENFLSIINRFGFIPNGGRIYYSERSQPPLLAGMIKAYVEKTKDIDFMKMAVPILEREFYFFYNNHMVEVKGYALAVYGDKSTGPRPESYLEDILTAQYLETEKEKEAMWSELKAGAESGMDFSSRWFIKNGTNEGELKDLKCRSIVPVELNAILFWNARIISDFHLMAQNPKKSAEFEQLAQEMYDAIQGVLWNEEAGAWFDYDLINQKPRPYFVPTNLSPLWTGAFNTAEKELLSKKVLKYINETGIDLFPGGVPNTLIQSGEQWDYPNVWPPMQYLLVEGLRALETQEACKKSFEWASRWVRSNFIAYKSTRAMFEKYSAEESGGYGGGGEYEIQLGFGWSNGVILQLLSEYGQDMKSTEEKNPPTSTVSSGFKLNRWTVGVTTAVAVAATIATHVFGPKLLARH
ncbi:trehalase isoform X3 [Contarinia nasturtii]|uniref:trehalase isoform X3 n=1 Tax=Contarinia nasturtii TaxID=265458 RepID=UPI0012D43535|nr:trehalase isoform X3 [Contarinia nasturtii]XP_031633666.1 trehalase isoform X3 [Contarinia nasturtii]XP_031633667.1 trehalase isoform X3 [Contarinia nasturtii]XP_031633669.1 trehalase isoform X3 [Contarinia nasturtii]